MRGFSMVVSQLVNHGVSSSLLEKLKYEIEEFFKLPLEEKMKYKIRPGDFEGYGTIVRSEDQKLDWGDKFYVIMNPIHRRKPYLFNELTSSLRFSLTHTMTHKLLSYFL
jgi:isopenicillin N synthase-like dioxygenase